MTQNEMHQLHAIRDDGQPNASLMDRLFARVEHLTAELTAQGERIEGLEREVRQLRTTVGGLVEHEQAQDGSIESLRSVVDGVTKVTGRIIDVLEVATDPRNARVNPVFAGTLVSFAPLVPSEPRG